MAVLVMLEWTFRELSENSAEIKQVREVQSRNFPVTQNTVAFGIQEKALSIRHLCDRWIRTSLINDLRPLVIESRPSITSVFQYLNDRFE